VWRVATYDLDGTERVHELDLGDFSFKHVLNGAKSLEGDVSMAKVTRAQIEPGSTNARIYDFDEVLRWEGRLWTFRADTRSEVLRTVIIGEDEWSVLRERMIDWEVRYEPVTESPANLNTSYGLSQEDILWDLVERSQAETGGNLGLTQGTHVGSAHPRRRWWCKEDGVFIAEVAENDFSTLSDGIDWAITPTLSDPTLRTLQTWNPSRGTDRTATVVFDGTNFLDSFVYEVDARDIKSRAHAQTNEQCDPYMADVSDATALSTYGLLEADTDVDTDDPDDADEAAEELVNQGERVLVADSIEYRLPEGPALGDFDVGDTVTIQSTRPGWELDIVARVLEIEVTVQLPHDEAHTFVRVGWKQVA
jgi:hypothetical protein